MPMFSVHIVIPKNLLIEADTADKAKELALKEAALYYEVDRDEVIVVSAVSYPNEWEGVSER